MKRVLIVGAGSYIGRRLEGWLGQWPGRYQVGKVSLRQEDWRERMAPWDAVVQLAGVVHRREEDTDPALYYRVNRDMAYEAARLARAGGAAQFIFLSSMSVYGQVTGRIGPDTPLTPTTHYGKSKLAAEALLRGLEQSGFQVAVLRPPMVFGPGCGGNYPRLARLARHLPCFPRYGGERSMIYVDNLCEAIRLVIDQGGGGCYFPQDQEYYNVPQLMAWIAEAHGRRMALVPGLGWLAAALARRGGTLGKVLGSLTYDRALPGAPGAYQLWDNRQAVRLTEGGERA
ncbi:MAG TPA: NAD-dependent epimerase/dehydratase family protein [Candidatus Excrementavichristensenella intestinipullorum]|nr:NAD-dependent epimerase/dehydratase family protein [Candidatus Excrementavichristensenella intestinipullorum]